MGFRAEYKIGRNTDTEWSGIFGYTPEGEGIPDIDGEMFAVIWLSSEAEIVDFETISKFILDTIQKSYFVDEAEGSIFDRLEKSMWKMKRKVDVVLSREPELSEKGLDIEISLVIIRENILYGFVVGDAYVSISRGDKFIVVSDAFEQKDPADFFKAGSLILDSSDRLLLATSKIDSSSSKIQKIVTELNINEMQKLSDKKAASMLLIGGERQEWVESKSGVMHKDEVNKKEDQRDYQNSAANIVEDQEVNEEISDKPEENPNIDFLDDQELPEGLDYKDEDRESIIDRVKVFWAGIITSVKRIRRSSRASTLEETPEVDEPQDSIPSNGESQSSNDRIPTIKERVLDLFERIKIGISRTLKRFRNEWQNEENTLAVFVKDLPGKTKKLIQRVVRLIKTEVIGSGGIRQRDYTGRLKRNRIIFIVLIVAFVGFVFIQYRAISRSREEAAIERENQQTLEELQTEFEEIQLASGTTDTNTDQRQSVLADLTAMEERVRVFINSGENEGIVVELDQLNTLVQEEIDKVSLADVFSQPSVIADLSTRFPETSTADIIYTDGSVFVSDEGRNVIYKLTTQIGAQPIEFIQELTEPQHMTIDNSGNILFYDNNTSSSIGTFAPSDANSLRRLSGLIKSEIGSINEFDIFEGNEAIYEIHQNNQQIFKRIKVGDSYGGGGAVRSDGEANWRTDPAFRSAIDIAVPFEVYVLVTGSGLQRHLAGGENELDFSKYSNLLSSDFEAIKEATAFDISGNTVAVADSLNQRILLFEIQDNNLKTLKFIGQKVYEGADGVLSDVKDLVLNTSERELYILDGNQVIRMAY